MTAKLVERLVLPVGLVGLALWLRPVADRMLTWDEVNYVSAAREGFLANAMDRGSMGPVTFVRFTLAKARGAGEREAAADAGYREPRDLLVVRHWHPPGGLIPVLPALAAWEPEAAARWSQLVWVGIAVLLAGALFFVLVPGDPILRTSGIVLLLLDPVLRTGLLELHFHMASGAALLVVALSLSRLVDQGGPADRSFLWVGAAVGLLLVTFSAAPVLLALVLGLLALSPGARPRVWDLRMLTRALPAALLVTLAAWPAGIVKLGLLKEVAVKVYAALFLGGVEWSGAGGFVSALLAQHPVIGGYLATLLAGAVLVWSGRLSPKGQVVVMLGVAHALLILPFTILTRYVFPLVPLAVAVALVLGHEVLAPRRRWLRFAPVVLLAVLLASGWRVQRPDAAEEEARRADLALVRAALAADERVLADAGHVYDFYLSDPPGLDELIFGPDGRSLTVREDLGNRPVAAEEYDRVVVTAWKEDFPVVRELVRRCSRLRTGVTLHLRCSGGPARENPR